MKMFIKVERHIFARLRVAPDAVLGTVQRHQLHVRLRAKAVNDAIEVVIQAGGVGDEAHMLAADQIQVFFKQDFNAEFYRRPGGGGCNSGHGLTASQQGRQAKPASQSGPTAIRPGSPTLSAAISLGGLRRRQLLGRFRPHGYGLSWDKNIARG